MSSPPFSDPLGAQLVKDMEKPGGNVTGLSDLSPVAEQRGADQGDPGRNVKTIGYLYNSGEANSVSLLAVLKEEAEKAGLTVIESAATKSAEVQGCGSCARRPRRPIYVPTDNTIISALEGAVAVAEESKLPLFTADTDSVSRGALGPLVSITMTSESRRARSSFASSRGNPGDIAVKVAAGTDLVINKGAATGWASHCRRGVVGRDPHDRVNDPPLRTIPLSGRSPFRAIVFLPPPFHTGAGSLIERDTEMVRIPLQLQNTSPQRLTLRSIREEDYRR